MPKHRDFLDLRLGTASQPIDVALQFPKRGFSSAEDVLRKALDDFERKERIIKDAPYILSLKDTGILGVYAPYEIRIRYTKGLLLQLCSQHSYTELKLVLVYDRNNEDAWEWARWLPT